MSRNRIERKFGVAEVISAGGVPGEILEAGKTGIVVACGTEALRILELQREGWTADERVLPIFCRGTI